MKKKFWVIAGVACLVLGIQVKNVVFIEYKVEGISMNPTFQEGNELVINKYAHHFKTIKRFDILLFNGPENNVYIKRVIGLPGDTIEYDKDQLYVDGKPVNEPFLKDLKTVNQGYPLTGDFTLKEVTGEKEVPENRYFVMGDNRIHSFDSRHFGFISNRDVVGIVSD
ncbi:signal peptidase I [Bacillus gobiensis]|uniref:signal peptidase I n=1 Tax=Bacillus gobiensis TaxID=1441095 RepID=UPI003D2594A4